MGRNKLIRARKALSESDKNKAKSLEEYFQKEKNNKDNLTSDLIKVSVGNYLKNYDFYENLIRYLDDLKIANSSHENPENSIIISRNNKKDIIISVYDVSSVIRKVSNGIKLSSFIEKHADLRPLYKTYLLIYGLEDYLKFLSNNDRNNTRILQGYDPGKENDRFKGLGIFEKSKLDVLITELQINECIDTILMDCPADFIQFVYQTAKAFTLIENDEVRWARCGNVVVRNKEHLKELWTEQLLEFNLITREITEAIVVFFETPGQLIEVQNFRY